MKKRIAKCIFLQLLIVATFIHTNAGHTDLGTLYGVDGAQAYAHSKHGIDGALFLDPYFIPFLESLKNKKLLDAGCGAGPWSIHAAKHGAIVWGVDIQDDMIKLAQQHAKNNDIFSIQFSVDDVAQLPYKDNFFDAAVSINVGCNLPSTKNNQKIGLGAHIKEMARVIKPGGVIVITAPISFGKVFSDGTSDIDDTIQKELDILPNNPADSFIKKHLNKLSMINRATFALHNERLTLIDDEKKLKEGENIWRKIPGLTVPNRYHSEKEYLQEFENAGLCVEKIYRPTFKNEVEWKRHSGLSRNYINHPAFVIFYVTKK